MGFSDGSVGKEVNWSAGAPGSIPGWGRPPGEGNGNHSSILAWKTPWIEEPGGLQSMVSRRVRHDLTKPMYPNVCVCTIYIYICMYVYIYIYISHCMCMSHIYVCVPLLSFIDFNLSKHYNLFKRNLQRHKIIKLGSQVLV